MKDAGLLANMLAGLLTGSGVMDGGNDYRVTITDKAGNVAEVAMGPAGTDGRARWIAEDGFDSDVAVARLGLKPADYMSQAAVQVWDGFVIAGRNFKRSLFTGTTWCSGCSSMIRSSDGVDTFDDGLGFRLCAGCGGKLAGLRLHRQFQHATWRAANGDGPAECIILKVTATSVVYERTNGRGEANGTGAVSDLVGFAKRLGAWL